METFCYTKWPVRHH
ncbi:TPA: hypothetical protein N2R15_003831 [Citrobacter amalonaticus]|nr:hypothetical protein [Citrobacter farmeri]HCL6629084.1 hypothetical protein [Citrobacter amalonaticus]